MTYHCWCYIGTKKSTKLSCNTISTGQGGLVGGGNQIELLGLRDLSTQLIQQAGREVNFMIYKASTTAIQRAPSITLPH